MVGLHRWGAVVIGFFGVLIMVVPGVFMFWAPVAPGAGFHLDTGTICAILSAFFLAFAIVLVKTLSAELSAVALLTYANVLSSILLLPFAIYFWSWPSMETWGWIFVMAGVGFVAQFCYISAVSIGDASFLSPLDYLRLPMATAADLIIVGMLPGMNVWIGAGIIIVSAVYHLARPQEKGPEGDCPAETGLAARLPQKCPDRGLVPRRALCWFRPTNQAGSPAWTSHSISVLSLAKRSM